MRLIYHHRTQAEDAQGIHIAEMIHAFEEAGHSVDVVALVEPGEGSGKKSDPGASTSTSASAGSAKKPPLSVRAMLGQLRSLLPPAAYELAGLGYNAVGFSMLARAILKHRPDFIYERYSLGTVCGVLAAQLFRIPIIVEVNAPLAHEQKTYDALAFQQLAQAGETWIVSNASKTITVTSVLKQMLVDQGALADKIVVMPNGINPREFDPSRSGERIRERYHLGDRVVLGFTGWFRPWHGLDRMVRLFAERRWAERGVSMLLVGDGPATPELRAQISTSGLEKIVHITGAVSRDELADHVAAFDVALQPAATPYASPMKLFEYLALGRAVVACDQPNIREVVDDGKTAVLFKTDSDAALAEAIEKLAFDPTMRAAIGRQGRESLFQRGYLWSRNAERVIALVAGLASAAQNGGQ